MYSRKKEDDMEYKFINKLGCMLVEDTGRRTQHVGDRIFESRNGHLMVVDHKSTIGDKEISLKKEWIEKVRKEADDYDPNAFGFITISFKGESKMLIVMDLDDLALLLN
jgi:hypothetical protein